MGFTFFKSKSLGGGMRVNFVLFVFLLVSCLSTPTNTAPLAKPITITTDNYPQIFDTIALRDGTHTKNSFEDMVPRRYGDLIPEEDKDKVYWENFNYFIANVFSVPGYIETENFTDRVDNIVKIERFYLNRRSYHMRNRANEDYIQKTTLRSGMANFFIPYDFNNPSLQYRSLSMVLYIDNDEIRLTDSAPFIISGGRLLARFNINTYRNRIASSQSFGYNIRDRKIMLDSNILEKLKEFLK